ncbi:MAG: 2-polyprenyl-3-methyl-6-methoxy-1,4-benzoquinone monooxygenase [Gammaproteobacteria bacterium]|nr:2-polyprenyl-3-methyl-6-methoxy-1,4-benzoquinone monooxygenase [Gammaproteobacteria bacterium]
MRHYSLIDQFLSQANAALTTVFTIAADARKNPAESISESELNNDEKKNSIGCMRVNHTGEVCAQALYRGQLMSCRSEKTRAMLEKSCEEETDHLAWTKQRLIELHGKTSYLNCLWYFNSYLIGLMAGLAGDRWSLGFVSETEIQVASHLQNHLEKLSEADLKSRAIVSQMRDEEMHHEKAAVEAGAADLPEIIKKLMQVNAKVMTAVAYYL